MLRAPGRPIARPDGWTYQHRVVLYDTLGPGPIRCMWLAARLDGPGAAPDRPRHRRDRLHASAIQAVTDTHRIPQGMQPA
jgi:hypothetical protein